MPRRLTWRLQPLDAYAFQRFKLALWRSYTRARADTALGILSPTQWLRVVTASIVEVFSNTHFPNAFARTGAIGTQLHLSQRISQYVNAIAHAPYEAMKPEEVELKYICGSGVTLHSDILFVAYTVMCKAAAPKLLALAPPPAASSLLDGHWSPRVFLLKQPAQKPSFAALDKCCVAHGKRRRGVRRRL